MKTRNGFVSNSSSSSFVVALPHKPESIEDLKVMMFGKQEWHFSGIYSDTSDVPTKNIASTVFQLIKKKASKKEVFESIRNGYFDFYIDEQLFPGIYQVWEKTLSLDYKKEKEKIDKLYEEAEKINNKRAKAIADSFIDTNKDKYIFVVEFSDENSWGSILEHSNIFQRLEHIKTSYH